ncbi:lipocalin-like domain-containing protein [Oryzibacter oryziterrae]|uniref:lipocalin-like domain-containing protein n=1 Tax=Oryzibacter oryziterrae TaxID=2766474 RepID=UPI001F1B373D|nr:lipocalin-like domain-containing protein [Oryzibacter oryziterrae]
MTHTSSIADRLVGTWTLTGFTLQVEGLPPILPMGPNVKGYGSWGADGWMSFLVETAERPLWDSPAPDGGTDAQTIAAARSLLAYAGPYTIDEAAGTIAQRLQHCLIPNWVGDVHLRSVRFPGDGQMELTSDPSPTPAGAGRFVLTFTRRPATVL